MSAVAPLLGRRPVDAIRAPTPRRDGPALVHLAVQIVWLGVSGWAALHWSAAGSPLSWAAVFSAGAAVVTFFPTLHEAGHKTAFESDTWNEAAVWLGAVVMLEAPTYFREFHWEHHRSTQDPAVDPEIRAAPRLLDDWPRNPLVYLGLVCGQILMVGKLGITLLCALTPERLWAPRFPYIRAALRGRVAWESRAVLVLLGGGTALGLAALPGFATLLWAWPIAHLLLGFYLMPEHTGLPNEGSQLERTRTVRSNAALRWLMWNMPYHAEHHAHPGVPFHALPRLHRHLEAELCNVSAGYGAFHREALRRCLQRGR